MTVRVLAPAIATLLALTACSSDPEQAAGDTEPSRAVEQPSEPADPPESAESSPETSPSQEPASFVAAVYYLGDTERAGPRLYREFRPGEGDPVPGTLELLATPPRDPDYRTAWRPGQLQGIVTADDVLEVVVDPSVRTRPAGMSGAEARAALQQVLYSLQAAHQSRIPVLFRTEDGPIDEVLGVPTPTMLRNGSMLKTLSHVSLTSPEQGATVGGDTLKVSGVGNSFEANLGWEIRQGDQVVDRGFATTAGWMEDKLFPFETSVDVSGLAPGDYTFWVTTDDPTGGTEGVGAMTDDKAFTIG